MYITPSESGVERITEHLHCSNRATFELKRSKSHLHQLLSLATFFSLPLTHSFCIVFLFNFYVFWCWHVAHTHALHIAWSIIVARRPSWRPDRWHNLGIVSQRAFDKCRWNGRQSVRYGRIFQSNRQWSICAAQHFCRPGANGYRRIAVGRTQKFLSSGDNDLWQTGCG